MLIRGRVTNGVIVLEDGESLPDGAEVAVSYPVTPFREPETRIMETPSGDKGQVQLPLVKSKLPGTRLLTAERVAELLDEEDVSA